jgi:hypothetical protein
VSLIEELLSGIAQRRSRVDEFLRMFGCNPVGNK